MGIKEVIRRFVYRVESGLRFVRWSSLDTVRDARASREVLLEAMLSALVGAGAAFAALLITAPLSALDIGWLDVAAPVVSVGAVVAIVARMWLEPLHRLAGRTEAQLDHLSRARIRSGGARDATRGVPDITTRMEAVRAATAALPRGYRRILRTEAARIAGTVDQVLEVAYDGGVLAARAGWYDGWGLELRTGPAGSDLVAVVEALDAQLAQLETVAAVEAASDDGRALAEDQARVAAHAKLAALRELLEHQEPHETLAGSAVPRARALEEARGQLRTG